MHIIEDYFAIFRRYPVLLSVGVLTFLATAGWAVVLPMLSLYLAEDVGIGTGFIGLIFGAYAISETILKTPFGIISDHTGQRPVIIAGLLAALVVPVLMLWAYHPVWFLVLQLMNGASIAAFWPIMASFTAVSVDSQDRATAMTVFNLSYLLALGIGPALGTFASHAAGTYRISFYLAIAFFSLAVLLALAGLRHRSYGRPRPDNSRYSDALREHLLPDIKNYGGIMAQLSFLWQNKTLAAILSISLLQNFAIGFLAPIFILFIKQELGYDLFQTGKAIIIPIAIIGVLALPVGRFSDTIGKHRAVRAGFLLAAFSILALPRAEQLWQLVTVIGLLGLAYLIAAPAWFAFTSLYAPRTSTGTAIASVSAVQSLGFILGPGVGGLLYEKVNPTVPFIGCGVLLLLCSLLCLIFVNNDAKPGSGHSDDLIKTG
ncbi:MAG: MFS transporter [Peptococcaceae bacterium]|nr:MFS transporter [Peptococcaceae bacterium]